jgi:hypothetical protein
MGLRDGFFMLKKYISFDKNLKIQLMVKIRKFCFSNYTIYLLTKFKDSAAQYYQTFPQLFIVVIFKYNGNEQKKGSFLSFGKYSKTNDLE